MNQSTFVDFKSFYRSKVISLDDALSFIKSNQKIVASMAAAEPTGLFKNLGKVCANLSNVTVYCANPTKEYDCFTDDRLQGKLELAVMFLTAAIRKQQGRGIVHYIPQHLSQWVHHLTDNQQINVFWGMCTPPDDRGFFSLGTNACYEPDLVRKADIVILEVNDQMPLTYGSTNMHINDVNHFVENSAPLPIIETAKMTETDHKIGSLIAELVPDGATLQLGIGGIPNAIGEALKQKKDLGIHTEMINDTMMDLFQRGVVTGREKSIWPGKIVGAFVYGSKALYNFVDGNPLVELHPAAVINDPYRIGRNHRMFSINTAVEIDLTGQVCSESIGHRELSGVGGASETHIGAQRSKGGRGIIAIPSTTKNGEQSKIVFTLQPGAKVSISRNDIDTLVTEFGVAKLAGKTTAQRVKALVAISHPKFREELLFKAKSEKYI